MGTIEAMPESMRSKAYRDLVDMLGGSDDPDANRRADSLSSVMDFVPVYGEAADADDAWNSLQDGQYFDAGVSGLAAMAGLIPIAGDFAAKGIKAAAPVVKDVVEEVGESIASIAAKQDATPPKPVRFKDVEQPELTPEQLAKSFKDGEITPYGRKIARGRAARDMAGQTSRVKKLSEVLGDMNIEGKTRLTATQSDRTRIKDGAGPGYPLIGRQYAEMAKRYQDEFGTPPVPKMLDDAGDIIEYPVWAVDNKATIGSLRNNLTMENGLLVPMIGSATQLRTNKEIFKKLKKAWMSGVKANKLSAEQAANININLEAYTGLKLDIRDPSAWVELEKTFDGRGVLSDIMSGKTPQAIAAVGARSKWRTKLNKKRAADGLEPLDLNPKTVPLGSRKGQIFDYEKILEDSTESVLLGSGTFSVGPTIIKPARFRQSETMPDAHPGFKEQLFGEVASDDVFVPTPLDIAMPNFIDHGRGLHMKSGPNKRPFNSGAWGMNARMGYPGQGLPSQIVDEDYLKHLQDMGYAEGGTVEVKYDAARINAMADALLGGENFAEGGEVESVGYEQPNLRKIAGDVLTDFASGIAGPIVSSSGWLMDKYLSNYTPEERDARYERLSEATNYEPRTDEAKWLNEKAMQGMGAIVNEGVNVYNATKHNQRPWAQEAIASGTQAYNDLDPETQKTIGHALTVGEVLPLGKVASMAKQGFKGARDARRINQAASLVPSESAYAPLQDRLEEMGARQLQVREPGDNNFLNDFDDSPITSPKQISQSLLIESTVDLDDIEEEFRKQVEAGTADLPEYMSNLKREEKVAYLTNGAEEVIYKNETSRNPRLDYYNEHFPAVAAARTEADYPGAAMTNRWVNTKLKKYIQNELGTGQSDSIVKVADSADNMHFEVTDLDLPIDELENQLNLGNYNVDDYGMSYHPDLIRLDSASDLAQSYEGASDNLIAQQQAGTFRNPESEIGRKIDRRKMHMQSQEGITNNMYESNPFLNKVPPETNIFTLDPFTADDLQLRTLTEGVRELVDPTNAAGLPKELRLPGEKVLKMSVGEVSARVGDARQWKADRLASQDLEVSLELMKDSPRMTNDMLDFDFAEGTGGTWVDLPDAGDGPKNMKTCTSIGKAGVWCTKTDDQAKNYGSGNSRLTALLDADGTPHVQIQITESRLPGRAREPGQEDVIHINEIKPPGNSFDHQKSESYIKKDPLYEAKLSDAVQDFLNRTDKEMKVGVIDSEELEMYGLVDIDDVQSTDFTIDQLITGAGIDLRDEAADIWSDFMSHRIFSPEKTPRIMKDDDIRDIIESGISDREPEGFARGGQVHVEYNPERINQLAESILTENFAKGGPVAYNANRINKLAERILQEA